MSEKVQVHHLIILDKSSSMHEVRSETIDGCNKQFDIIRKMSEENQEQEHFVSMVIFSYSHKIDMETIWMKKSDEIENINNETYVPDGYTALFDAIGRGVTKLQKEIQEQLNNRGARVVVTILTDGHENNSQEFTGKNIKSLIDEHQKGGLWTITMAGCTDDVFDVADNLNISRGNVLKYDMGALGTTQAFSQMAKSRSVYCSSIGTDDELKASSNYYSGEKKEEEKKKGFFANIKESMTKTGGCCGGGESCGGTSDENNKKTNKKKK